MSRLVKIVNNKYVQIEEYKNPNICFNTNEYDNFEDYCILREIFDPFEIFYENQELKLELSGYRQAILNNKEMLGLKEENEKLKQENKQLNNILTELEETIKNKIKGFKEDKDYFIDEKDMYELDNLIQKLKEEYK